MRNAGGCFSVGMYTTCSIGENHAYCEILILFIDTNSHSKFLQMDFHTWLNTLGKRRPGRLYSYNALCSSPTPGYSPNTVNWFSEQYVLLSLPAEAVLQSKFPLQK